MKLYEVWGIDGTDASDIIKKEDYIAMAMEFGTDAVIDHVRANYPDLAKQVIRELRAILRVSARFAPSMAA